MAEKPFVSRVFEPGADVPAVDFAAVTPSDATDQTQQFRALYIGGAGNVAIVSATGAVVTFVGLAAGTILPVSGIRVNSTNTTATSIVALY